MTETTLLLVGLGVVGLGALALLVLRLGKRLATFLLALGGLVAASAIAAAMFAQAQATRQVAQAAQEAARAAEVAAAGQAVTSAATSVIAFLLVVILLLLLTIVGAGIGLAWWRARQRQARVRDLLEMAQYHALLNSTRSPAHPTSPAPSPALQSGGNVFIVPGAQQSPGITLDDLARALHAVQGQPDDSMAELFPPDEWRVLE